MPTKRTTNKLSQLYKTIDQKELSADAKKALADLRLATGNFRKQEGKEADAFMLFYNRLVNKKPTAVKTTKEYKAMLTERRRENGRKAMEARKAKQESRQGQGSERDAARPAKPFGWRLKGKHNYRKPTRADIRTGKAYYEARINRADTKRTKFPMLERGGEIEKQEKLINYKIASVIGIDETFKYLDMDFAVSPLQLIRGAVVRGFITVDEINRDLFDAALAESYYIDELYKDSGQGIGSSDETAFIANMLRNAGIDVKVVNGRWQRMERGGYMSKGGEIHVVLNEGNGKIINKLFNDWNNVKTEKEYEKWVEQVRSTKFGTYGTITYDEVLRNFDFDNAPINSYHLKTFKAELKNALNKGYKYAKGGAIENQYKGRESEDIWNNLTRGQRLHFLIDHEDDLKLKSDGMSMKDYFESRDAITRLKFSELEKKIQEEFSVHTMMGQYAKGGEIPVINISDDDKLNYFIKKQNRKSGDSSFIDEMLTLDYKGKTYYSLGYDTPSKGQVFSLEEAQDNAKLVLKIFRGEYDVLVKEVGGNFPDEDFMKKTYVVMTSPLFPNYMLREMKYTLKYADGGEVDKGGMIYALREFVSSGEIANKTDVLNYDDIAKIRRIAIQYYMDNGDVPYSYGELAKVLSYANDKFKSGMMAKGGAIKYSTYDNKSIEYIEGEIAHTERSARQFQQMGDYESMEDRKEHVKKLREIYNKKRAESKMAKGGVFYTDSHKQGH